MLQPSHVNDDISYLIIEKKQLRNNQQEILNCFRNCSIIQLGSSYGDDENCIDPSCKDLVKRIPFDRENEYLFIITKTNETKPAMQEDDNTPGFQYRKPQFKKPYDQIPKLTYIVHADHKKPKRSFWQILSKIFI